MIGVAVGHDDLRQRCALERLLHGLEMPWLSSARVDERRHTTPDQPRPIAVAGVRTRIERVNRNRLQQLDCVNRCTMLSITLTLLGEIRTTPR